MPQSISVRHRLRMLLAVSVLVVAACGQSAKQSSESATSAASPTAMRPSCTDSDEGAFSEAATAQAANRRVSGARRRRPGRAAGPAKRWRHCQWLPTGRRLAADGYLVGLMDWTSPFDTAVTTAAALLREAGATELVLVGASRGGAYVLGVAGTLRPAPAGVVSFSGEGRLGEWDADARIRSYRGPLLRLGSEVTCTASCSPARTRIRSRPRLTSS
jgi:hypothetical protein